mmetsp:Transcript_14906/g.43548  ORF Transcript_14906/g.43548 Transcript_14906/m.43548 type:complete len:337 (+) Transcript_14906:560-1570(+)
MPRIVVRGPAAVQALLRLEAPELEQAVRPTTHDASARLHDLQAPDPAVVAPQGSLAPLAQERPELHRCVVASAEEQVLVGIVPEAPDRPGVAIELLGALRAAYVAPLALAVVLLRHGVRRAGEGRGPGPRSREAPQEERAVLRGGERGALARVDAALAEGHARDRAAAVGPLAHERAHGRQPHAPPLVRPPACEETRAPRGRVARPGARPGAAPLAPVGSLPQAVGARVVEPPAPGAACRAQRAERARRHHAEDGLPELLGQRLRGPLAHHRHGGPLPRHGGAAASPHAAAGPWALGLQVWVLPLEEPQPEALRDGLNPHLRSRALAAALGCSTCA